MNEERIKDLRMKRDRIESDRDSMGEMYTGMILIIEKLITELEGGNKE